MGGEGHPDRHILCSCVGGRPASRDADRFFDGQGASLVPAAPLLHGDTGDDSNAVRRRIENLGATANIPPKAKRRWKPCFSPIPYRDRSAIERMFGWLKHFGRIATRCDILARNFPAAICRVALVCYWFLRPAHVPFAFSVFKFLANIPVHHGRCATARDSLEQDQGRSPTYTPTSVHLSKILDHADGARVTIGWLTEQLGERSFGLTLFLLALLAFVPGAATASGVLIAWPAVQMILGHDAAVLPRFVARREIRVDKLSRAIRFAVPKLERVERLIRPRWPTHFQSTKRLTGAVMLLLGLTMVSPVPLGHLLSALVVMLLALAYLEKDGVALMVALVAALGSIAVAVATVWGTVETIDWLDPAIQKP